MAFVSVEIPATKRNLKPVEPSITITIPDADHSERTKATVSINYPAAVASGLIPEDWDEKTHTPRYVRLERDGHIFRIRLCKDKDPRRVGKLAHDQKRFKVFAIGRYLEMERYRGGRLTPTYMGDHSLAFDASSLYTHPEALQ